MSNDVVRVLFVDDEQNILFALKRLMMDEEFEVLAAASGEEGLAVLQGATNVGLIVSDQRMLGMCGAEFLQKAKKLAPDALRIILTGYADINATIDAINKGEAYRYIAKPWNDQDLLQTIREAIRNYSLASENKRLAAVVGRQNEELKGWNAQLKSKVLEQTQVIREKNAELQGKNRRLRENFKNTIVAFSDLIELRAEEVRNHSKNVALLSVGIAKAMGLSNPEIEGIYVAAMLHDIGKIGIPDEILHKLDDQMDPEDVEEYRRHAVRGQAAIDAIEDLRGSGELIRHHHEHFDGGGYPDGLAGQQIPVGARIIALADFIDREIAVHKEFALEKTLRKVKPLLNTQFDPELGPFLKDPVRSVYGRIISETGMIRKVLRPADLRLGMVLMENLYSGTGLLLLSKGACIDEKSLRAILRYQELDPFKKDVAVLMKG